MRAERISQNWNYSQYENESGSPTNPVTCRFEKIKPKRNVWHISCFMKSKIHTGDCNVKG